MSQLIENSANSSVMAVAGRRIDAAGTRPPRFPAVEEAHVREELVHRLTLNKVQHLVCSAACGTDILALEAATDLGILSTVVLPFPPAIFRSMSVTDRPGDWGVRFDRLLASSASSGNIIVLDEESTSEAAFMKANWSILYLANEVAIPRKIACVAWEGGSREGEGITAHFLRSALSLGFETDVILTVSKR
jgi:hypothetical protein